MLPFLVSGRELRPGRAHFFYTLEHCQPTGLLIPGNHRSSSLFNVSDMFRLAVDGGSYSLQNLDQNSHPRRGPALFVLVFCHRTGLLTAD